MQVPDAEVSSKIDTVGASSYRAGPPTITITGHPTVTITGHPANKITIEFNSATGNDQLSPTARYYTTDHQDHFFHDQRFFQENDDVKSEKQAQLSFSGNKEFQVAEAQSSASFDTLVPQSSSSKNYNAGTRKVRFQDPRSDHENEDNEPANRAQAPASNADVIQSLRAQSSASPELGSLTAGSQRSAFGNITLKSKGAKMGVGTSVKRYRQDDDRVNIRDRIQFSEPIHTDVMTATHLWQCCQCQGFTGWVERVGLAEVEIQCWHCPHTRLEDWHRRAVCGCGGKVQVGNWE